MVFTENKLANLLQKRLEELCSKFYFISLRIESKLLNVNRRQFFASF